LTFCPKRLADKKTDKNSIAVFIVRFLSKVRKDEGNENATATSFISYI
jgi:hypothetical protein